LMPVHHDHFDAILDLLAFIHSFIVKKLINILIIFNYQRIYLLRLISLRASSLRHSYPLDRDLSGASLPSGVVCAITDRLGDVSTWKENVVLCGAGIWDHPPFFQKCSCAFFVLCAKLAP
jgi:hypothetical protein